jgi:4-hydroxythreonine-4-phosphate dehydrogenase
VAVAALNPHASDNGKFGTEEKKILAPVIRQLQKKGFQIEGPFPSDSLWYTHSQGKYDGILCMYHDQALAPLKIAAKEPIVHITAGLKFLRTSPTHGTAFDIAGKNQADPSSMIAAILFATVRGKKLISY